ncbi:MAG: type IV pilus secretin PilQ [Elusimicrobiota bacterium]
MNIIKALFLFIFSTSAYTQMYIEKVDFSKDSVIIKHSAGKIKYFIKEVSNPYSLVIEISNSSLKTLQDQPVSSDMVKRITTTQSSSSVSKITIEGYKKLLYEISETDTELIIKLFAKNEEKVIDKSILKEAKVIPPKTESAKKTFRIEKKDIIDNLPKYKIDTDYQDADIRDVLTELALRAGINVIFQSDVSGVISLSLRGVPFDEVFKTVLNMKGLVTQQVGDNIIKISTPQKLLDEQKNSYLQTRVFFLNYVKASDIKTQIESIAQAEGRTTSKCNVDTTNNALIVTDTPFGLDLTERLVKKLDRMPKQVIIEAKLVEVNLDSGLYTGVQWSVSGSHGGNYVGANSPTDSIGPTSKWGDQKSITPGYSGSYTGTGANLNAKTGGSGVELPADQIYGAFRFGRITSNFMFDAVISAAAKKGKAKILSNPKIATLNNTEATINITNQTPYVTQDITYVSGNSVTSSKVTYITTGIILKVLPTITSDGRILMKVNPTVSKPSQTAEFAPPSVDQRTADTTVVVEDGETIVIGGLIHDYENDYEYKVPLLGDIPLLGYLFKKKGKERTRMELLIFVTPKIVE